MSKAAELDELSSGQAEVDDALDRYARTPAVLSARELIVLAHAFERTGCDEQALDCADRAARLDPSTKEAAVAVAQRVLAHPSRPM